jgi:anti-sigma factor RsiW
MKADAPTDVEISAYIDDELALPDRLTVESYLARNPQAAAELMENFRARTALRLFATGASHGQSQDRHRLSPLPPRSVRFGQKTRKFALAAATGVALAVGIVGIPTSRLGAAPPDYLADAIQAHRTGILRAAMTSQLESPELNSNEILASTSIHVPSLPKGWRVTDVQLFPSDEGPALQIMIRTTASKAVSIFAVRHRSSAPLSPIAIRQGEESIAYWRNGEMSYALTGADAPAALEVAAEDLANETHS